MPNHPSSSLYSPDGFVGLIGAYGVGKDYVAEHCFGGPTHITRIAHSLYALAKKLSGVAEFDKRLPGARETLQRLGAWGRGDVNNSHPLSAERVSSVHYIQSFKESRDFGSGENFWIDSFERWVWNEWDLSDSRMRVCPDVRHSNELPAIRRLGKLMVVLASPETLEKHRAGAGYKDIMRHSTDVSEDLANAFQCGVRIPEALALALRVEGPIDGIIWNDKPPIPDHLGDSGVPVFFTT